MPTLRRHRPHGSIRPRRTATLLACAGMVLAGLAAVTPGAAAASPSAWQPMALPGIGEGSILNGVSCVAADDCTAVGDGSAGPLVEHFDGTTWTKQDAPGGSDVRLEAVSCPSASSCTAVGDDIDGSVVLRWDGDSWTRADLPSVGDYEGLRSVSCADDDDCVAVGAYYDDGLGRYRTFSDVLADGSWFHVTTSSPGNNVNEALGVSCVSANDCTLVGYYSSSGGGEHFLVEHYNGSGWSAGSVTDAGSTNNELNAVDCVASDDCTAVGYALTIGGGAQSVIEHWDGSAWTQTSVPYSGHLSAIACSSATECTAAGQTDPAGTGVQLLTRDSDGWSQSIVATPRQHGDGISGVACPGAASCFLTGQRQRRSDPSTTYALVETSEPQSTPVVAGLDPARGDPTGGTSVTVSGAGFTGTTGVSFGGAPATAFSVDSDTQITATAPEGTDGDTVPVTVTTAGGTSSTWFADRFDYVARPEVDAVTPDQGSDEGGATVVVTGSGFTDVDDVYFVDSDGGEEAWEASADDVTVDSDTRITVITPSTDGDFDGTADVIVDGHGMESAASPADHYVFGTPTELTLHSDAWTVYPLESAEVTATIDPAPDSGTVTFHDGSGPIQGCTDLAVDDGEATCVLSYATARHVRLTADYSGDAVSLPADATHELVVDQQPTTAALAVSDAPTAGTPVTYTLTVSPAPDGGTVAFSQDGDGIAGCAARPVDPTGVATCTTTYHSAGEHDVLAAYSGNGDYSPSQATAHVGVVRPDQADPTTIAVYATPSSPTARTLVAYVAQVSPAGATGTVGFQDGGADIAGCEAVPVRDDGSATCLTTASAPGDHHVGAEYSGDDVDAPSTSATITVHVSAPSSGGGGGTTAVTATLGVSPAHPAPGDPVTYTVALDPAPSGGTVTFTDAGDPVPHCSAVPVDAGSAACTVTYPTGSSHRVTASYSGDSLDAPATSAPLTVIVLAPTSTTFTTVPNAPETGTPLTYGVTVSPVPDGGTVTFRDGADVICADVAVDTTDGTATCTATFDTAGDHDLSASYDGTVAFAASATGDLDVDVARTTTTTLDVARHSTYLANGFGGFTLYYDLTLTATVDPVPDGGTVTFTGAVASSCGPRAVSAEGTATCAVPYIPPEEPAQVAAHFDGTDGYAASDSTQSRVTFPQGDALTLTDQTDTPEPGASDIFTATLQALTNGPVTGGTITFEDGDGHAYPGCADLSVASEKASCPITFDATGTHTVKAAYSGTDDWAYSQDSRTIDAVTEAVPTSVSFSVVDGWFDPDSTTTIAAHVSPVPPGGDVSFTVTPTPRSHDTGCDHVAVDDSGTATCTLTWDEDDQGPFTITADYSGATGGDTAYLPSTAQDPVDIDAHLVKTGMTIAAGTPTADGSTTLTATLSVLDPNFVLSQPAGKVTFAEGGDPLGGCTAVGVAWTRTTTYAPVSGPGAAVNYPAILTGTATCTPKLGVGSHTVTASYRGGEAGLIETSGSDRQTVYYSNVPTPGNQPPSTDVTVTAPAPPSAPGGTTGVVTATSSSSTGTAAASSGGVAVAARGAGALTLGSYPTRPSGVSDLDGKYFDLKLAQGSEFHSIVVKDCHLAGARTLWFWNGSAWVKASNQRYDATTKPPCITVTITATTKPRLAQLTGTVFAAGKPVEKPVLKAHAHDGRIVASVRTMPRITKHRVTVYVVRHHHGHTVLHPLGHAITNRHGRIHFRLKGQYHGILVLRAKVSGSGYAERLSKPVRLRVH